MNKVYLLLAICLLSACSTLPATVDVPVAVPCQAPPPVARPHLAIADLRPDSPPAAVIKAYRVSLEEMGGYARQLERLLWGYR